MAVPSLHSTWQEQGSVYAHLVNIRFNLPSTAVFYCGLHVAVQRLLSIEFYSTWRTAGPLVQRRKGNVKHAIENTLHIKMLSNYHMKSCQVVWVTKVDPVWERQGERVLFILCWLQQPWEYLDLFIFACVNIRQWVYFPWKCFMDCKRQRGGEREERVVEGRKLRTKSWTGANNPTTARKGEVSSLFLFFFSCLWLSYI